MDDDTRKALRLVANSHRAAGDALAAGAELLDEILESSPPPEPEPEPDPEPPPPEPVPLVRGPLGMPLGVLARRGPGHNEAPEMAQFYRDHNDRPFAQASNETRGTAPVEAIGAGVLQATLARADVDPVGGATGMHEQHLSFPAQQTVTWQVERMFRTPELGRTGKAGGVVSFDGDWSNDRWPDGHVPEATSPNAMIRSTHWHWDQRPGTDRLCSLLTFGAATAADAMVFGPDGNETRRHIWSDGHTLETYWDAVGRVPIGRWIRERNICHFGTPGEHDGWVDTWACDYVGAEAPLLELVQSIRNISWAPFPPASGPAGFNRWYTCLMYGGTAEDWAPANPAKTGVVLFRSLKVWAGEVRP